MNEDEYCARQVEMQQRDILADAPCDRLNYTAAHWIGIGDADGDSRDGEGDGGDGDDDDGDSDGGAGKGTRSIDTWVVAKVLGDRSDEWHDHRWRWWERKCGDESWWADFDIHFLACMPELDQLSPEMQWEVKEAIESFLRTAQGRAELRQRADFHHSAGEGQCAQNR